MVQPAGDSKNKLKYIIQYFMESSDRNKTEPSFSRLEKWTTRNEISEMKGPSESGGEQRLENIFLKCTWNPRDWSSCSTAEMPPPFRWSSFQPHPCLVLYWLRHIFKLRCPWKYRRAKDGIVIKIPIPRVSGSREHQTLEKRIIKCTWNGIPVIIKKITDVDVEQFTCLFHSLEFHFLQKDDWNTISPIQLRLASPPPLSIQTGLRHMDTLDIRPYINKLNKFRAQTPEHR